jgi:glycosyltransferase involved in cell wall biosynthesis
MIKRPNKISVVICALNEGKNLRRTVESYLDTLPPKSEIIVIDDGCTDGSTRFLKKLNGAVRTLRTKHIGVARGRNLGATKSRGDVIVFSDAHVAGSPGWWKPMLEVIADPRVGGVAPTISDMTDTHCKGWGLELSGPNPSEIWLRKPGNDPFTAPLLPWCSTAMRRDTFEATGGFDSGMLRWGSIDNEMSVRLWLLGYECWVVPEIEFRHVFRDDRPYDMEWSWALHNKLRIAFVHFETPRIARVVDALKGHKAFPEAVSLLAEGDVSSRRKEIAARRVHDAEWYFKKFGPKW